MRSLPRSWGVLFAKLGFTRRNSRFKSASGIHRKLRFEQCEDRRMLATFTVTNTGDGVVNGPGDQPGTLRQAVFDSEVSLEANDKIVFALSLKWTPIIGPPA